MPDLSDRKDWRSRSVILADTLLDYVQEGTGWHFAATSLKAPFSDVPGGGGLLPAESLKERMTPDSFRVAGSLDPTGYFRVGKDLWHPGHGVGLLLSWRAPASMRLNFRIALAPVNSWVTSFATCGGFLNKTQMISGRCEGDGFCELSQTVSVREGDVIHVLFGYDGVIDHLECLYRATLEKEDLPTRNDSLFFDARKMRDSSPLAERLSKIVSEELNLRGVKLGQAGFFSIRNR